MGVKKLDTGMIIELIGNKYIRTYISEGESLAIKEKRKVHRETIKHFTRIDEKSDDTKPNMRELYYKLTQDGRKEIPLEFFRLQAVGLDTKQKILDGLIELLLLVETGKIYDIELNPLNFIAEYEETTDTLYIKAFYRRDRGLREITDEWLESAKKLIGYFLISDTGVNETNYNELSSVDLYEYMTGKVADEYLKIIKSPSIDKIAREWFTEDGYEQLRGFPPIVSDYKKPRDVTNFEKIAQEVLNKDTDDYDSYNTEYDLDEDYEPPKQRKRFRGEPKKKILLGLVVFVGIIIGVFIGMKILEEDETSVVKVEVSESYYKGLLQASIQKYKDASDLFDTLTEEELSLLSENEMLTIYISYLKSGEFDKALEIDPEGAETVITYLRDKDELEKVLEIESSLPPIQFEKAVIEKDYNRVISLKGEVRDTEERQINVIEAFVMTGQIDIAVDYIKEKGLLGLESKVREFYNQYAQEVTVSEEEVKEVDKMLKKLP